MLDIPDIFWGELPEPTYEEKMKVPPWPQVHNLNKFGRGSSDDITNIMSRL